jgi:hypothetical protein
VSTKTVASFSLNPCEGRLRRLPAEMHGPTSRPL